MSEFVEATERLAQIRPAVSLLGSARVAADSPCQRLAETIARRLSDAGFSVISGGGRGGDIQILQKRGFAPLPAEWENLLNL